METVQVRFPRKELEELDREVKIGRYPSRSEAIRDMVRRAALFDVMKEFMELAKQEKIKREDIEQDREKLREECYEEMFG